MGSGGEAALAWRSSGVPPGVPGPGPAPLTPAGSSSLRRTGTKLVPVPGLLGTVQEGPGAHSSAFPALPFPRGERNPCVTSGHSTGQARECWGGCAGPRGDSCPVPSVPPSRSSLPRVAPGRSVPSLSRGKGTRLSFAAHLREPCGLVPLVGFISLSLNFTEGRRVQTTPSGCAGKRCSGIWGLWQGKPHTGCVWEGLGCSR